LLINYAKIELQNQITTAIRTSTDGRVWTGSLHSIGKETMTN